MPRIRAGGSANGSAAAQTGQLQTLHRALDLLERLAANGSGSLGALSQEMGLARATTHRLLTTLTSRGYLTQDPDSGRYAVGLRAFEVGSAFFAQNQLKDVVRPVLRELNQQYDETLSLAMLDGDEAVYVDVVESGQTLRTFARVGARVPLYATGVGKALLTGFSPPELERYLKGRQLRPYTPHTVTSGEALAQELQRAHETGYVLDREEYHIGVRCGAAAIRNHAGQVIGVISISGPASRIHGKYWTGVAAAVAGAAGRLSQALGYRRRP